MQQALGPGMRPWQAGALAARAWLPLVLVVQGCGADLLLQWLLLRGEASCSASGRLESMLLSIQSYPAEYGAATAYSGQM